MARKRKEITGDELYKLLERISELKDDVEEANAAIDNHIPLVRLWEGNQSNCLWLGMELSKLSMRLQTIERCWQHEQEMEELRAKRMKA